MPGPFPSLRKNPAEYGEHPTRTRRVLKMTEKVASPLLTEDDAAAYLLTSSKTLANWRWRGVGPSFVKLGGSVRYRQEALDEYIASRTRGQRRRRPELVGEGGR